MRDGTTTDVTSTLDERSLVVNRPEQLRTALTDDEPSVEFDPVLATKGQGPYARSNQLTTPFRRRTISGSHEMSVAAPGPERGPFPFDAFVRASSLHVGAANRRRVTSGPC